MPSWGCRKTGELIYKRTMRLSRVDGGNVAQSYRLGDHSVTMSRAVAWFSVWPRRGIDLDILLGCGPFGAMEGSHLCNHESCIVPSHITWEAWQTNTDRQKCHRNARFLRSQGHPVPPSCKEHQPPCLLQHAALTTLET